MPFHGELDSPNYQKPLKAIKKTMNIDALRILDGIDQYVFLKDAHRTYVYANEAFAKIAGVTSREALIGKTDYDLIWKDQAERWTHADNEVLAGRSSIRQDETYKYASEEFRVIMTRTPYHAETGEIVGVLGNFYECTGRLILKTTGTFDHDKHRLYLEFVPDWLSAAEVRVCFYLIHGFQAARIAEKIGVAVGTVRFHIENIKNKMQCKNKGEIVEVAMRTGIAWKIFSLQHDSGNEKNYEF